MTKPFNHNIQEEVLDVCEKHGVPDALAEKVSFIMASDDATLPNLGRTSEDVAIIHEVLPYLNTPLQEG